MIEYEDILIAEMAGERHKKRRKEKLKNPALCYACKKKFLTGVELFEHLDEKPLHKIKPYWVSYTIGCNKCSNFKEQGWRNIPSRHIIPSDKETFLECRNIYVESIQITPYFRKNERYTITDFDQIDLLTYNGKIAI